jgi:hypothetical protein
MIVFVVERDVQVKLIVVVVVTAPYMTAGERR